MSLMVHMVRIAGLAAAGEITLREANFCFSKAVPFARVINRAGISVKLRLEIDCASPLYTGRAMAITRPSTAPLHLAVAPRFAASPRAGGHRHVATAAAASHQQHQQPPLPPPPPGGRTSSALRRALLSAAGAAVLAAAAAWPRPVEARQAFPFPPAAVAAVPATLENKVRRRQLRLPDASTCASTRSHCARARDHCLLPHDAAYPIAAPPVQTPATAQLLTMNGR